MKPRTARADGGYRDALMMLILHKRSETLIENDSFGSIRKELPCWCELTMKTSDMKTMKIKQYYLFSKTTAAAAAEAAVRRVEQQK